MYTFAKVVAIIVAALIVLMLVGGGIFLAIYPSTHHQQRTFTITDKQAVAESSGNGHEYLIYTDQGTFKDTDSLINKKFNSSDLYGQLKVNHKYSCDTTGFRFGFTSMYPNLISCTEVK